MIIACLHHCTPLQHGYNISATKTTSLPVSKNSSPFNDIDKIRRSVNSVILLTKILPPKLALKLQLEKIFSTSCPKLLPMNAVKY